MKSQATKGQKTGHRLFESFGQKLLSERTVVFAINTVLILAIDGYLDLIKHEKLLSLFFFSGLFTLFDIASGNYLPFLSGIDFYDHGNYFGCRVGACLNHTFIYYSRY